MSFIAQLIRPIVSWWGPACELNAEKSPLAPASPRPLPPPVYHASPLDNPRSEPVDPAPIYQDRQTPNAPEDSSPSSYVSAGAKRSCPFDELDDALALSSRPDLLQAIQRLGRNIKRLRSLDRAEQEALDYAERFGGTPCPLTLDYEQARGDELVRMFRPTTGQTPMPEDVPPSPIVVKQEPVSPVMPSLDLPAELGTDGAHPPLRAYDPPPRFPYGRPSRALSPTRSDPVFGIPATSGTAPYFCVTERNGTYGLLVSDDPVDALTSDALNAHSHVSSRSDLASTDPCLAPSYAPSSGSDTSVGTFSDDLDSDADVDARVHDGSRPTAPTLPGPFLSITPGRELLALIAQPPHPAHRPDLRPDLAQGVAELARVDPARFDYFVEVLQACVVIDTPLVLTPPVSLLAEHRTLVPEIRYNEYDPHTAVSSFDIGLGFADFSPITTHRLLFDDEPTETFLSDDDDEGMAGDVDSSGSDEDMEEFASGGEEEMGLMWS